MVVTVLYQEARVFWLCPFSSCSFLKFPIPSQVGCYFGIILKMNISRSLYYSKAHYTWEQSILGMNLHLTRARASPVSILETEMNSKSNTGHTKHLLGERSALSPFMKNEQLIFPPLFSFPFLFSLSPFPLHASVMAVHRDVSAPQPYETKCLLRSVQIYGVLIAWHVKRWDLAALIGQRTTTGSLSDCKSLVADWGRAGCPLCHMMGGHERVAKPGECCPWHGATLFPNSMPWQRWNMEEHLSLQVFQLEFAVFFFLFVSFFFPVAANLVTRWTTVEERISHLIKKMKYSQKEETVWCFWNVAYKKTLVRVRSEGKQIRTWTANACEHGPFEP